MHNHSVVLCVHRASDRIRERQWLEMLAIATDTLEVSEDVRSIATDLYLSAIPHEDRSKPALLAASCYTACLIAGEERSQSAVAQAFGVSRLSVQSRWKHQLESVGLTPPNW